MVKVLFVCLGNICRSPMAQSVFQNMTGKRGLSAEIDSAAARADELGNPPHRGTCEKLAKEGIPLVKHYARRLTREDGEYYDYLIGMDESNVREMKQIVGWRNEGKVFKLLDFTSSPRSIADPWYTGDFDRTYEDICMGLSTFLDHLQKNGEI